MIVNHHPLTSPAPGTTRELHSLHFGPSGTGRKAVIQASLHADEVPGLLVAHHLRHRLAELEAGDLLRGEVVLVPVANPIGLSQRVLQAHHGRFDLASGENFNRHYADVAPRACELVAARIGGDAGADPALVREALRRACAELPGETELQSLRRALLGLAIDADLVLDLHCDNEAVLHLYTATELWPEVEPLARLLGAEVSLVAEESGDEPFDEACSTVWSRLAAQLSQQLGRPVVLAPGCVAVTIELRGETDVRHDLAAADAAALLEYLAVRGFVDREPAPLPGLKRGPTPLAGSIPIVAPHGGVVVFLRELGASLRRGEHVADLVDPLDGTVTVLESPVDGVLYARERQRFAAAGARIAKVAGRDPLRSGKLLSA
jgi:predicted deacylase